MKILFNFFYVYKYFFIFLGFSTLCFLSYSLKYLFGGIRKRIKVEKDKKEDNGLVVFIKELEVIVFNLFLIIFLLLWIMLYVSLLFRSFGFHYFDFIVDSKIVREFFHSSN